MCYVEADLLTQKKLTSKNISCFLFNRTIMSCIRESRISGRIANTIIFRGKFFLSYGRMILWTDHQELACDRLNREVCMECMPQLFPQPP